MKILYAFPFSPVSAVCPAHLILFDLIILIMLGKGPSYEAPHYAFFRYRKQIVSVLLQWPLVCQEGPCTLNLILSDDFQSCREEICREQLLWVRCNEK
jgi:hypothetical protein